MKKLVISKNSRGEWQVTCPCCDGPAVQVRPWVACVAATWVHAVAFAYDHCKYAHVPNREKSYRYVERAT